MGKKKTKASPPQATKVITSDASHKALSNKPVHASQLPEMPSNGTFKAMTTTTTTLSRDGFLKLFWNLAESDVQVRNAATHGILQYLRAVQQDAAAAAAADDKDQADATEATRFDEEKDYTLKRLIRGLASSRDAARQGFSCALANLLRTFAQEIELHQVLDLLLEYMQVRNSQKGMEQREHMFGRLFGLLAIQRSGRLAVGVDANKSAVSHQATLVVRVIRELIELSKWKKWLREAAFEGILTCLEDCSRDVFVDQLLQDFTNLLAGPVEEFNAEQVALAAGLHHYLVVTKLIHDTNRVPESFLARDFLKRKQMHRLVEPLKQASGCFPRIHSAWYGLFGHLLAGKNTKNSSLSIDGELFQETWQVLVEDMLLVGTHERKSTALKLFEMLVPLLPSALVRTILTPHLVRCLFVNAVNAKNYLHQAALHALDVFFQQAPQEFFSFVLNHFARPHAALVDEAKTKDADGELDDEELRDLQEEMHKRVQQARIWLVELLCHALTQLVAGSNAVTARVSNSEKHHLAQEMLRFLIVQSFCKPKTSSSLSAQKRKHSMDANTLLVTSAACTTVMDSKSKSKSKAHKVPTAEQNANEEVLLYCKKRLMALWSVRDELAGPGVNGPLLLVRVFEVLQDTLEESSSAFELRVTASDKETKQMERVVELVTRLDAQAKAYETQQDDEETAKRMRKQLEAFGLLLRSCGLQLVDEEQAEREEICVVIDDCVQCLNTLTAACVVDEETSKLDGSAKKKKKNKTKMNKPQAISVEEQEQSVVVLVDLLLSLLAKDSRGLRAIVMQVFGSVWHLMTPQCLATLMQVVTKPSSNPTEGPNDDEDDEEEDEEGEDDNDDDDEMEDAEEEEEEEEEEIVLSSASQMADVLDVEEAALVSIVQQVQAKKEQKQTQKRLQLQTLHFQMRVVDVLQLLLQKSRTCKASKDTCKSLLLVVPLYLKLVQLGKQDLNSDETGASAGAIRATSGALKDILQSLLKNKLLQLREVPCVALTQEDVNELEQAAKKEQQAQEAPTQEEAEAEEEVEEDQAVVSITKCVKQAHELLKLLGTKQLDRELSALGAKALAYLVRVLCHSLSSAEEAKLVKSVAKHVSGVMSKATHESFGKKHSRFPRVFFDELLGSATGATAASIGAELDMVVLPALVDQLAQCADEFCQVECFKWVTLLLKQSTAKGDAAPLEAAVHAFVQVQEPLSAQLVVHLSPVEEAGDAKADGEAEAEEEDEGEEKPSQSKQKQTKPMKAKRFKVIVQCAAAFLKFAGQSNDKLATSGQTHVARVRQALDKLQSNSPAIKNILNQVAKEQPAPAKATITKMVSTPTKAVVTTPSKQAKMPTATPPNTPAAPAKALTTPQSKTKTKTKAKSPKSATPKTKTTSTTSTTPTSAQRHKKRKHSMDQ